MEDLFPTLTKVLNDFGPKLIQQYKEELTRNKRIASGNLVNSLSYEVQWRGGLLELSIELESYFKFIEEGTKPHWPPPKAILDWIRIKPIAPRAMKNGKLPTLEQLSFLIGRKISQVGTKGTHDLQTVEDANWDYILNQIDEAVEKDISNSLDEMLELLWK